MAGSMKVPCSLRSLATSVSIQLTEGLGRTDVAHIELHAFYDVAIDRRFIHLTYLADVHIAFLGKPCVELTQRFVRAAQLRASRITTSRRAFRARSGGLDKLLRFCNLRRHGLGGAPDLAEQGYLNTRPRICVCYT